MVFSTPDRWSEAGKRPVRIANVSGGKTDPGYQMHRQATLGNVDFLTGDYLAEVNIAENAEAMARGEHDGWEPSALEGLEMTLEVIAKKRLKVIINGGAQNPAGLAGRVQSLVSAQKLELSIAYVYGDNILPDMRKALEQGNIPPHLDTVNTEVALHGSTFDFTDVKSKVVVSSNAYLGARAIVKGLEAGADIIICGRVADASPVIGAAWWWHNWSDTSYDELAQALIAGHLLECSAYCTGSNFSGFDEYPEETFVDVPFPIAEISRDGTTIVTKHENTNGMVNEDTCRSQFLYELQGNMYLNSDVSADLRDICIKQVGKDRVSITGVRGLPPPPTTKLAIFYRGGWGMEFLSNATGYGTAKKWSLFEKQIRYFLQLRGVHADQFQALDFQVLGTPAHDPETQFSSTSYCRIFAQAESPEPLRMIFRAAADQGQQHFSGFHLSWDLRTVVPKPYLAYFPALYPQASIKSGVVLLASDGSEKVRIDAGNPPRYTDLKTRDNYETTNAVDIEGFETQNARFGDIVQARSGDKGANINIGFFVRKHEHYSWLQSFLTTERMKWLMGKDWRNDYFVERCEFPRIAAVHFVIYGPLGRGVSSCRLLDSLGKGFADYIRDRVIKVPTQFLYDICEMREQRAAWQEGKGF